MNLIVFEDHGWRDLLPLTWLRPAWELRCGCDRLLDKLCAAFTIEDAELAPRSILNARFARQRSVDNDQPVTLANGRLFATQPLSAPELGAAWFEEGGDLIAATVQRSAWLGIRDQLSTTNSPASARDAIDALTLTATAPPAGVRLVKYAWELPLANDRELRRQLPTSGASQHGDVSAAAHLLNSAAITVDPGATVAPGVVLDARDGPIFIGAGAEVQPNAVVIGPAFVGARSIIRPHATIREGVSIGERCKIGGELEASIVHGFANKQHDGFLGHSYLCPWVNFGAGTMTSDLKNTYGDVRVTLRGVSVNTRSQFVGSLVGDHVKTAIGTRLPTGCFVGVAANVLVSRTAPKQIPSFTWLTDDGAATYDIDKALAVANTVMQRRDQPLTDADVATLRWVAENASQIEAGDA